MWAVLFGVFLVKLDVSIVTMQKNDKKRQCSLVRVLEGVVMSYATLSAYGHSHLGEWIFGGMTRELLATSPICCVMSH